jgi:hypothetical protein
MTTFEIWVESALGLSSAAAHVLVINAAPSSNLSFVPDMVPGFIESKSDTLLTDSHEVLVVVPSGHNLSLVDSNVVVAGRQIASTLTLNSVVAIGVSYSISVNQNLTLISNGSGTREFSYLVP